MSIFYTSGDWSRAGWGWSGRLEFAFFSFLFSFGKAQAAM